MEEDDEYDYKQQVVHCLKLLRKAKSDNDKFAALFMVRKAKNFKICGQDL